MTVYPGLIDSETNLGLSEIEADEASNDLVETSDEILPHMHVYDAFHAETEHIPVARLNGITNAIVAPASDDTMPGQDIFIQLAGRDRDQMILGRDVALAMNFSARSSAAAAAEEAAQSSPQHAHGAASQLRQTFIDAQALCGEPKAEYQAKLRQVAEGRQEGRRAKPPKCDLKMEALHAISARRTAGRDRRLRGL